MKYNELITTAPQAYLHLMLMFSIDDVKTNDKVSRALSSYFTYYELTDGFNLDEEITKFLSYRDTIQNPLDFFSFLLSLIGNEYGLFIYLTAADLAVADAKLTDNEIFLLDLLGSLLNLSEHSQDVVKDAVIEKVLLKQTLGKT